MTRSRARRAQCVLLAAAVAAIAGRARAAGEGSTVINLRVVASPAEAREMRAVLADLLSRIDVGIADDGPAATQPSLVDVEIDLSTGNGGPFVVLTTRQPRAIICRRLLSPQASREVLIESAAEVAYAAVESRARVVGVLRADTVEPPPEGRNIERAPATRPPQADVAAVGTIVADAAALQARASNDAAPPWYGVDAAGFAEVQLRNAAAGAPATGGGAAVTLGLRGIRFDPALVLALSYLRPAGSVDPAAPRDLSIVSTRLGATVDAFGFRWISLQVGPSLALDVVRGEVPQFTPGPPPAFMMQMTGETASFSGLAIWAGGSARLSIRVARSSHFFVAAGADYQLRQAGSPRPPVGGPPNGANVAPLWSDSGPSGWRSSFLVGLAFTLAGRPLMTD
jgi:hypothetical protein